MNFMRTRVWIGITVVVTGLLLGCYSFSATSLPPHIKTLRINEVENRTHDPMLSDRLRLGFVELFRKNAASVRIVNSDAHAEFSATLKRYSNAPQNWSRNTDVQTYQVTMTVDVVFKDMLKDEVIYEGTNLNGVGVYDVSKNESEDRHGQERALDELRKLIIANALSEW
jgi:hypothetical protein